MKKAIVLTLAVVLMLSSVLFLPQSSLAEDACTTRWNECRESAMGADVGWIRTTIMLTICDLAWGKCQLAI